jgi:Oxysterol-binding protein
LRLLIALAFSIDYVFHVVTVLFFFIRLLEEGKLAEAEAEKQRLEQMQREKRKTREDSSHSPMWFT